jgi:protein disulfide-isomerase A1
MKFTTVAFACLLIGAALTADGSWGYPEEDHVIVMTEANFDEIIQKHEFVLVEFYAPWCGHCKKLTPEWSSAAQTLKSADPAVPLGKVDATENAALGTKYGVTGYPTIKFFVKGEPIDFNGGRTAADIVQWAKKKTGPASIALADAAALDKVKADNKVAVIYVGADNINFQNFLKVAQSLDAVAFAHSHDNSLGAGLTLYKQFDEGSNKYTGDFSADDIKAFIAANRYPVVMPFEGDEAIERVFGKEAAAIVLFTDATSGAEHDAFKAVSRDLKNTLIFTHSTATTGLGQRLSDYIGVKAAETPAVWIIHPKSGDLAKFPLNGAISADNIRTFVSNFQNGKLDRHFKSAEIPAENNEAVKVVVGKNWNDVVINNDVNVLVKFYAPWCGHCKTLAPIWEEVGQALAGNSKILLVKVDSTENEIPGVSVQGFPTLKFYKAGQKDTPIDFAGERTKEGIIGFLKEQTGGDWTDL